jgi:electron transport complex protein RnfB
LIKVFELITQYPLLTALLALLSMGAVFGAALGFAAVKFKTEGNPIADQINDLLPQTQCGQCGYPGCRPYSQAIVDGEAINRCPPGGEATIAALADLLDVEAIPLNAEHGEEKAAAAVAYIREDECIGCTKCIQACPVDAILGAAKQMHTVIVSECTGCDLCVEPCPVDCIDMIQATQSLQSWYWSLPDPNSRQVDIIATDAGTPQGQAA